MWIRGRLLTMGTALPRQGPGRYALWHIIACAALTERPLSPAAQGYQGRCEVAIMTVSAPGAAGSIFISYRREDTAWPADRLSGQLEEHFGQDQVFRDVQSIQPGDNFVETITTALEGCAVLCCAVGAHRQAVAEDHR